MEQHTLLRVVAKFLIPFILLFALYVQFHGDYSPGGGFQAGVLFAAGVILYGLIFGLDAARQAVPIGVLRCAAAVGVLLYAGTGMAGIFLGGQFLNYNVLLPHDIHGQHLGILLVELGVGLNVFATLTVIYFVFAGRARHRDNQA